MNMWVALVIIVLVTMGAAVIMKRYETLGRTERAKGARDADERLLAEQREAEQQKKLIDQLRADVAGRQDLQPGVHRPARQ